MPKSHYQTNPPESAVCRFVLSAGYGMRGEHAHVAVVETDGKTEPSMISFRGRGVSYGARWERHRLLRQDRAI